MCTLLDIQYKLWVMLFDKYVCVMLELNWFKKKKWKDDDNV